MKAMRQTLVHTIVISLPPISLRAHEMPVKGTVAAIEKTRIQVKSGLEKAGEPLAWSPIMTGRR